METRIYTSLITEQVTIHDYCDVPDSDPKCHVSVNSAVYYKSSTPVYLHENDVIVMSCTVAYWGNWPPTMKWTITGGAILKTDTPLGDKTIQNKTMTSNHTLKIKSSLDNVRFTCDTYFVLDNKPDEKFGSTNIPVYQNTWESPTISLLQREFMIGWNSSVFIPSI